MKLIKVNSNTFINPEAIVRIDRSGDGGVRVQLFGEEDTVHVMPSCLGLQSGAGLEPVALAIMRLSS